MTQCDALEQGGGLIRVAGQPAGFSIWQRQDVKTAAVHFEKALRADLDHRLSGNMGA
jgi:hypothetical protein